jgi:hypothetical protein
MWNKNPKVKLLSAKILQFSQKGAELFNTELGEEHSSDSKEYQLKFFQILSEFIYFTLHITNRIVFSKLGQEKRIKFQKVLLPIVAQMIIELYFEHWPRKYKKGIKNDFIDNLNNAEIEYSKCKTIFNKEILTKNNPRIYDADIGLINQLCFNLGEIMNEEREILNIDLHLLVVEHSTSLFKEKEFENIVIYIGNTI